MGKERKGSPQKKLLFPIVDRQSQSVISRREVLDLSAVLNPETALDYDPLAEKAANAKGFERQVRGHRRRPTKAPRRTVSEGAALGKAVRIREGLKQKVMADQVDLWLNQAAREGTLSFNGPKPVFIAAEDLQRIRNYVQDFMRVERLEPEPAEDEDPEIRGIFEEDQLHFGQGAEFSSDKNDLLPRVQGPAIHWVEKPEPSDLS